MREKMVEHRFDPEAPGIVLFVCVCCLSVYAERTTKEG